MKSSLSIYFLAFSAGVLLSVKSSDAQLKIYVNTDLEGISGVFKFSQTREKDTPLNIQACEYFMGDVAAVVKGLRDGGATEVVILDGHGTQAVLPNLMVPGAKYITGTPRPGAGNLTELDGSFAGMVMLGFHAMKGTPDGVLNHTQSSKSENRYWYNGVESGELAQSAAIAGYYGVPPIMVTGDEATCREAKKFFGDRIVTVAVKRGLARESAMLYPFDESRKALYEGAKRAVAAVSLCKPYIMKTPIQVKEEYLRTDPSSPKPVLVTREGVAEDALHLFTWAKTASAPGSAVIKKCTDFKITGIGNDENWNKAEWINILQEGNPEAAYETKVKILYSETGVYFLYNCRDQKLTTTMKADNLDLWNEDVVELFLWTDETFPVYFEYEISPVNYELPIMVPNYHGSFLGWLPWHYEGERKIQHATSAVGGKKESGSSVTAWIAEFYIPYKVLAPLNNVPPVSGTKWRANIYRIDYDNGKKRFMWQPVDKSFHEYNRFGTIIFE